MLASKPSLAKHLILMTFRGKLPDYMEIRGTVTTSFLANASVVILVSVMSQSVHMLVIHDSYFTIIHITPIESHVRLCSPPVTQHRSWRDAPTWQLWTSKSRSCETALWPPSGTGPDAWERRPERSVTLCPTSSPGQTNLKCWLRRYEQNWTKLNWFSSGIAVQKCSLELRLFTLPQAKPVSSCKKFGKLCNKISHQNIHLSFVRMFLLSLCPAPEQHAWCDHLDAARWEEGGLRPYPRSPGPLLHVQWAGLRTSLWQDTDYIFTGTHLL